MYKYGQVDRRYIFTCRQNGVALEGEYDLLGFTVQRILSALIFVLNFVLNIDIVHGNDYKKRNGHVFDFNAHIFNKNYMRQFMIAENEEASRWDNKQRCNGG